jgi:hypothetical protein
MFPTTGHRFHPNAHVSKGSRAADLGDGRECPILLKADIQLAVSERPGFGKSCHSAEYSDPWYLKEIPLLASLARTKNASFRPAACPPYCFQGRIGAIIKAFSTKALSAPFVSQDSHE